jgi:signal transduction histidine kinase
VTDMVDIRTLVEDSLRMNEGAFSRHGVTLVRDFQEVPEITVDKHKVLQILVNVIRNAKYACDESSSADKRVTVRVRADPETMQVAVIDTGVGIPPENLERIFSHGFTTRKDGHGFGLHSCALAAKELGGSLQGESPGPGQGATFTLTLPLTRPETPRGR